MITHDNRTLDRLVRYLISSHRLRGILFLPVFAVVFILFAAVFRFAGTPDRYLWPFSLAAMIFIAGVFEFRQHWRTKTFRVCLACLLSCHVGVTILALRTFPPEVDDRRWEALHLAEILLFLFAFWGFTRLRPWLRKFGALVKH